MTDLREEIFEEVYAGRNGDVYEDCYDATDRILALMREALLSEEAVVTAVYAGMRHRPNTPSHYRATTKAQLAAAGITTGDACLEKES